MARALWGFKGSPKAFWWTLEVIWNVKDNPMALWGAGECP